jgi:chaperonin GroEL
MIEKRHRIEDALEAVKAARDEGIVPGGGTALIRCVPKKPNGGYKDASSEIVWSAVCEPLKQMASNAGCSPDVVLENVRKVKGNKGWDFTTSKIVDMIGQGIIDPAKVTRCALQNAASVAGALITSGYAIVEGE